MAKHKLSETRIRTLPVGIHSDGDGLFLRVGKEGSRQWFFIYKRAGKRTELGLGGYGFGTAPVSLALRGRRLSRFDNGWRAVTNYPPERYSRTLWTT
ncbi:Arm DNA-binding domain-containing protein [Mesorhizobium sp. M0522]|uniref:Arm DNA-binding domain-containing protein n=1 Tax=Mesorhizobium sp. M0522 TaxID=2956958 RepID=UPI00333BB86B